MKKFFTTTLALCALAVPAHAAETAKADILGEGGDVIGQASFVQGTVGAMMNIEVSNLPPGPHGFHIHAMGHCDTGDGFKSAHGHINPQGRAHGYLNEDGPEIGDLPNLIVHEDGTAMVQLFLPQVNISEGEGALLDEDGSALVIHENPDDHVSQPIGGAGPRIACGVIKQGDGAAQNE